ncbi:MAG: hypothetical protein GXX79_09060 [Actinomycetales bacterium]|nr:hypothetical protein [Actinomycetales bacterium]
MNATRGGPSRSYGQDDRYSPIEATRRGAHRARPTPAAAVAPVVAVVAVVAVVLVGLWALVGSLGGQDSGGDPEAGPSASQPATPSDRPSQTPQQSQSPTESTEQQQPQVDRSLTVKVLNNTSTAGLAKKAADQLKAAGWTIGEVTNHRPLGSVPQTTVYYATMAQRATAQAVAADLGTRTVQRSPTLAGNGLTAILASDYQP